MPFAIISRYVHPSIAEQNLKLLQGVYKAMICLNLGPTAKATVSDLDFF